MSLVKRGFARALRGHRSLIINVLVYPDNIIISFSSLRTAEKVTDLKTQLNMMWTAVEYNEMK